MTDAKIELEGNLELDNMDVVLSGDLEFEGDEEEADEQCQPLRRKLENVHLMRRLASENQLERLVEWELQPKASYHFLSNGDIDSFSYLKFVLRQQPLKYLIVSSWVIAKHDIEEFEHYLRLGRIKLADFYVGEIFPKEFSSAYSQLAEIAMEFGGRVATSRNHCKAMVGFGEKFNFVLESSGNINTNTRSENTCLTLNSELARFYKDFFDNIRSALDDFEGWKPWREE